MPPKSKRSHSPDPDFLFVNEDASTVTRATKDAELDRSKQRHVQRRNFARRRRLRDLSTSGPPTTSPSTLSPSPIVSAASTALSSATQLELAQPAKAIDSLPSIVLDQDAFRSFDPPPPLLPKELPHSLTSMLTGPLPPTSYSTSYTFHPPDASQNPPSFGPGHFGDRQMAPMDMPQPLRSHSASASASASTASVTPRRRLSGPPGHSPGALELWAPPLIQHYNTVILPETFWLDTHKVALGQMRHAALIHADMQACMAQPAHMYAFLALAATQMMAREGRLLLPGISEHDGPRLPTYFKTKAIQALRSQLAAGVLDHRLAMDVHRLYETGIHAADDELAEPHFQALLSMVETFGGVETFDDYQLEKIMIVDCTAALEKLEIPRLLATLNPGPLDPALLARIVSQRTAEHRVGSRLTAALVAFYVPSTLSHTLPQLVQIFQVAELLSRSKPYVAAHYKWLNWGLLTVLHQLLSLPLHHDLDGRTDCIRVALAYWTAILRAPAMSRRSTSKSTSDFRDRLQDSDVTDLWRDSAGAHAEVLLWIAAVGGICAADTSDVDWFVRLARRATQQAGISSVAGLEALFTTFLYEPRAQRDLLVEFSTRLWPQI